MVLPKYFAQTGQINFRYAIHAVKRFASWTLSTDKHFFKSAAEELDYFKVGKLADYPVPDKVTAVALNEDPPAKFVDRIR